MYCLRTAGELLEDIDVISFDPHSHGSLDSIDGYDQCVVACGGLEYALDSVQGAAANSHSLADLEKRIARTRNILFEENSDRLDLLIGNYGTFAVLPNETYYPIGLQHPDPRLIRGNDLREYVAGE